MSRIKAMAELFGVSSQYLLGLSTSPTLKDFPVIELKFGVSLDSLLDYYSNLERFPSNLPVSDSAFFVRLRLSIVGDVNMFSFVNHKYALKNNPVTDLNILGVAMQSVLVTGLRDLFWRPIVA